jgi:hypothetical protein
MKIRHSILTAAMGMAIALSASGAQAQIVQGDRSLPIRASASSQHSAAALRAMGIRFQAAKNERGELLLTGSGSAPVRPDDRGVSRLAGLVF